MADAIDKIDSSSAVRWRMEAVRHLAEKLSDPTPELCCDAPSCDCLTKENSRANEAAEPAWTLTRGHVDRIGDTLKLSDGHEVTEFAIPVGIGYGAMKEALHVLFGGLRGTIPICRPKRKAEKAKDEELVICWGVVTLHERMGPRGLVWVIRENPNAPISVGSLVSRVNGESDDPVMKVIGIERLQAADTVGLIVKTAKEV